MSDPDERPRRERSARPAEEGQVLGGGEARRTERLTGAGDEWSQREPVNPGWRSERERSSKRPTRRGALPASPQEFQLWLQAGGWRFAAGIAVLIVVLLIAMLAFARNDQRTSGLSGEVGTTTAPTSGAVLGSVPPVDLLPTVTVAPPTPAGGQFFVIAGTGAEGLNLRADHSTTSAIVNFYPDGTRLEQIGEDFAGADRVWRNVRAPDGQEGWVAVDFLTPAP